MSTTGKQLFSTLADGKLGIDNFDGEFSEPTGNQILVQMEAALISHWQTLAMACFLSTVKGLRHVGDEFARRILRVFQVCHAGEYGKV